MLVTTKRLYPEAEQAEELFLEGYACSQSMLMAFSHRYGLDIETAKRIASTFGGGMSRLRKTCGALTGAFMVLGLEFGNVIPNDMDTKLGAYKKVRDLKQKFEKIHGCTDCRDLLKKYTSRDDVRRRNHHRQICYQFVREVGELLTDTLDEKKSE